jgi:hypothetical protein
MAMQQYTLVVQNAVSRRDLGVATAALQFFRNVGNTVGIAIFGSVMTAGMAGAIASHLPPELVEESGGALQEVGAAAALDPAVTAGLPPEVLAAVRAGLADQLHDVFLLGLPILAVVLLATLAIRAIPLRETVSSPEDAQNEYLDTMAMSAPPEGYVPSLRDDDRLGARTRERVLGIELGVLARQACRNDRPLFRRAVLELGAGDLDRGRVLLARASRMLTSDDPREAAEAERYAVELGRAAAAPGGVLSEELRQELAVRAAAARPAQDVLSIIEPTVAQRHEAVDLAQLRQAASELSAVLLVELAAVARDEAPPTDPATGPA